VTAIATAGRSVESGPAFPPSDLDLALTADRFQFRDVDQTRVHRHRHGRLPPADRKLLSPPDRPPSKGSGAQRIRCRRFRPVGVDRVRVAANGVIQSDVRVRVRVLAHPLRRHQSASPRIRRGPAHVRRLDPALHRVRAHLHRRPDDHGPLRHPVTRCNTSKQARLCARSTRAAAVRASASRPTARAGRSTIESQGRWSKHQVDTPTSSWRRRRAGLGYAKGGGSSGGTARRCRGGSDPDLQRTANTSSTASWHSSAVAPQTSPVAPRLAFARER